MANEMVPALSGEVEGNQRYNSPPSLFTQEGQMDRWHENQHKVAIRDADRQLRENVAGAVVAAGSDIAWIEARAKVNTEAKYAIHRAQRESRVIAEDDPELQAKFGIMDDDNFHAVRAIANRPRPSSGGLFG